MNMRKASSAAADITAAVATVSAAAPCSQGLTLVHFSAQRKRFEWDRGCIQRLMRGCLEGMMGHEEVSRMYFVPEMAQVELKSGRV